MLAQNGALYDMINAGARILKALAGVHRNGQAPKTNAVSARTFNRNLRAKRTKTAGLW